MVKGLLEALVERGVRPERRFRTGGMIDGSKALRAAIDAVFGDHNPVQRCRNHKVENVVGRLPQDLRDQVKTVMNAAYRLPADEGIAKPAKAGTRRLGCSTSTFPPLPASSKASTRPSP